MMDKNMNEVEKMMEMLEDIPQVKASPGFYQRTKYKLDHLEEEQKSSIIDKLLKFTLTPALIGASIALGIFIGLGNNNSHFDTKAIDAFVETYDMQSNDVQQLFIIE